MVPRIKVSVLSLLALTAIGAATASAAQASGEFTADAYPATITGTQLNKHAFKFEGPEITCAKATFHGELPAASSELTLDPVYSECKTNNGNAAVVEMTSCDYVFHTDVTAAEDEVNGSLEVECAEAGDHIDFVVPSSGCKFEIGPEQLQVLVFTDNTVAEDFDVDFFIKGFTYKQNAKCPGGAKMGFAEITGKSTIQADFEETGIGTTVD